MNKLNPYELCVGEQFYFYESKKGKERYKYRLAEVLYMTRYFIVAQVYTLSDIKKPIYRTCFNFNSVACGDVVLKKNVSEAEKANSSDSISDM